MIAWMLFLAVLMTFILIALDDWIVAVIFVLLFGILPLVMIVSILIFFLDLRDDVKAIRKAIEKEKVDE